MERKTIEQIKDDFAKRIGFSNYARMDRYCKPCSKQVDEIMEAYASQERQLAVAKALEVAERFTNINLPKASLTAEILTSLETQRK